MPLGQRPRHRRPGARASNRSDQGRAHCLAGSLARYGAPPRCRADACGAARWRCPRPSRPELQRTGRRLRGLASPVRHRRAGGRPGDPRRILARAASLGRDHPAAVWPAGLPGSATRSARVCPSVLLASALPTRSHGVHRLSTCGCASSGAPCGRRRGWRHGVAGGDAALAERDGRAVCLRRCRATRKPADSGRMEASRA